MPVEQGKDLGDSATSKTAGNRLVSFGVSKGPTGQMR